MRLLSFIVTCWNNQFCMSALTFLRLCKTVHLCPGEISGGCFLRKLLPVNASDLHSLVLDVQIWVRELSLSVAFLWFGIVGSNKDVWVCSRDPQEHTRAGYVACTVMAQTCEQQPSKVDWIWIWLCKVTYHHRASYSKFSENFM